LIEVACQVAVGIVSGRPARVRVLNLHVFGA
jgi:hypothetical protein